MKFSFKEPNSRREDLENISHFLRRKLHYSKSIKNAAPWDHQPLCFKSNFAKQKKITLFYINVHLLKKYMTQARTYENRFGGLKFAKVQFKINHEANKYFASVSARVARFMFVLFFRLFSFGRRKSCALSSEAENFAKCIFPVTMKIIFSALSGCVLYMRSFLR